MEATEKTVSEEDEQVKTDHLTEHQRKVFEALRQMNVHRYCPPASQIAQKADLAPNSDMNLRLTKEILTQLCRLGIVIWRIDESGDDTYRLTKPEEFIRREHLAAKNGEPVSPKEHPSSTSTVSPKVEPKVQPKVLSCPKCDFVTKTYAGLQIHIGQKHKTAADLRNKIKLQELKTKKKAPSPDPPASSEPLVTITLTMNEALETGIALVLADLIDEKRFEKSHKVVEKVLKAIAEQVARESHFLEAN